MLHNALINEQYRAITSFTKSLLVAVGGDLWSSDSWGMLDCVSIKVTPMLKFHVWGNHLKLTESSYPNTSGRADRRLFQHTPWNWTEARTRKNMHDSKIAWLYAAMILDSVQQQLPAFFFKTFNWLMSCYGHREYSYTNLCTSPYLLDFD